MLARCILANPSRSGRSHWRDTQKAVWMRITKWRAGQLSELWDEILGENNRHNKHLSQKCNNSSASPNFLCARRAAEDGQYRKAIQILSSAGITPSSRDVLDAMLSKHPQSPLPPLPPSSAPLAVCVSELDVVRVLQSVPNGTAAGPSSHRANHLNEAVFFSSPIRSDFALKGLVSVVNLFCAGHALTAFYHSCVVLLYLLARRKPGGFVQFPLGRFCGI